MPFIPGNERFKCWMCEYFPVSNEEPLPPGRTERRYCLIENGPKAAGSRICPHGKLDRSRIERSKKKTGPRKTAKDPAQSKLEGPLRDIFIRCLENADNRGLIRTRKAGVTMDQLEELSRLGLVELRDYNQSIRPFVPRIAEKKSQFLNI